MQFLKNYPYTFNPLMCESCDGNCCIGESGYIWVNSEELVNIAEFLSIDVEVFKRDYLRKVGYKYSIKEIKTKTDYECIFFDRVKKRCDIYEVRPKQCKTFPFWDYYKTRISELERECPGIQRL